MLKQVNIDELKLGMFVKEVHKQTGNVKVRASGIVKTEGVIAQLRAKGVQAVTIDLSRSEVVDKDEVSGDTEAPTHEQSAEIKSESAALTEANDLYSQAVTIQKQFVSSLVKGKAKDLNQASELSRSIIDSVFDNQDALSCLTMIKEADEYLLEHSINCSIFMSIFASHLGYDRDTVEQASLGALLMDVGMSSIPQEIYQHDGALSTADWDVMKSHVELGIDLLEQHHDISDLVLDIISQHHERCDGSGYPKALMAEDISTLSKMAAIVDTYDAMVSSRLHQKKVTPAVAFKKLSKSKGLDQSLVKKFIQCLGFYPVGSLVRLKSGRLGLVSQRNPDDALNPIVMTFYSISGDHYSEIKRVDLSKIEDEILSAVTPEEFSINLPKFFKEIFISQLS